MWNMLGRSAYEGFDPVKSTIAARARNFAQVANMPVVLMEGDRTEKDHIKQTAFDYDDLKPLFDGRSIYSRGVKNSGNETYEPLFDAALVISMNASVQASPAMMERLIHISFDKSLHTHETKEMADARMAEASLVHGAEGAVQAVLGALQVDASVCRAQHAALLRRHGSSLGHGCLRMEFQRLHFFFPFPAIAMAMLRRQMRKLVCCIASSNDCLMRLVLCALRSSSSGGSNFTIGKASWALRRCMALPPFG